MAELYTLAETNWPGAQYYDQEFLSGRPDLTLPLAELQARNPFYSTPEYLDYRRQLAGLVSSRNDERQRYEQQANLLANQYRELLNPITQQQLPQNIQQGIFNELQSSFLRGYAPEIERTSGLSNYFKGVADSLTNFVNTAKPGEAISIPRNPYVGSSEQPYGGFVLDNPSKPYTFEQRQTFANRGLSVVDKDFIQYYLNSEIVPKQNQWQTYTQQFTDPNFFLERQGQQYQERLAQEEKRLVEEANRNRLAQIAQVEGQQRELQSNINPLVSSSLNQEEALRQQLRNLQSTFTAAERANRFGVPVEQVLQEEAQFAANVAAQSQSAQQAQDTRAEQLLSYIQETGRIPTSEAELPEQIRNVPAGPPVTAAPVQTPTLPNYSFLSQDFSFAPTQTVTQPVAQPPQPVTPVTQPVAQPVTTAPQPVAQQPQEASFLGGIPVGIGGQVQSPGMTMATTPSLNPATLPELRSAGGGGTSAIDPTLRPYLELGLRAAEQQFLQNVPQFFPGQTYVSPSQQTLDALAAQEQIARQAPGTLQAAQESYMRGLGGLGATAGGAFLMGNPFQQQMIQAATRPIMQQFEEQTLPGIASGFSQAGRYGSGAMERALGRATESTARAIGDVSTNIAYQDYGAERGRQQQAILGQITAAGQAPQIYGQQFLPSQQLAQIGAAREAIAGLPLQEQMQRFQFAQQAPRESLSAFLSSVYGTPMARSQYAPTPETQTNRFGNVLGGAATGAAIGGMIPSLGAGYGAGLGALGGLLL